MRLSRSRLFIRTIMWVLLVWISRQRVGVISIQTTVNIGYSCHRLLRRVLMGVWLRAAHHLLLSVALLLLGVGLMLVLVLIHLLRVYILVRHWLRAIRTGSFRTEWRTLRSAYVRPTRSGLTRVLTTEITISLCRQILFVTNGFSALY